MKPAILASAFLLSFIAGLYVSGATDHLELLVNWYDSYMNDTETIEVNTEGVLL